MASELMVPVVELHNVRKHPNADKMDVAEALGYQVCLPVGQYKTGDVVTYFPADVLLPREWADKFGVTRLLKGAANDRVGKLRLRGEPSFGLVVACQDPSWKVGDNVASFFGVKKYLPPLRTGIDEAPRDDQLDPFVQNYTDIQNGRLFVDVFAPGEEVVVTEKLHGTNCKLGIISGSEFAGSMGVRRTDPGKDKRGQSDYWYPWSLPGVDAMLHTLVQEDKSVRSIQLFGEVYGGRIQNKLIYGVPGNQGYGFAAFDILVNERYMDWDVFKATCDRFGVEVVPVLFRGPFDSAAVLGMADGPAFKGGHVREGVVVKPVQERLSPRIGRCVLKYVGTEYDLLQGNSDFRDV